MPDGERRDLFDVDPNDFVAERDELVRDLKASGNKDEAAAVKKLRRPPVALWAINQVARREPKLVDTLLEQASEARSAQDDAIASRNAERLRTAMASRRDALAKVAKAARRIVDDSGRSGDAQDREIEDALTALTSSGRMTDAFRAGELTTLPATDDDADDLLAAMADSLPAQSAAAPEPPAPSPELLKARDEAALRAREANEADEEVRSAEAALAAAQKAQAAAARELERAEERVAKLER